MNDNILIHNIFYMLSYAFRNLRQEEYRNIEIEEFDNTYNLFSRILYIGVSKQLKQGLYKEYLLLDDNLSTIRGKINLNNTLKNKLAKKQIINCEFDELTENNLLNQILKSTLELLVKGSTVKKNNKIAIKRLLVYFGNVENIELKNIKWNSIKYQRNNRTYQMLINICYLVVTSKLNSSDGNNMKLVNFLDDQQMCHLYEKFVLEYYKYHFKKLKPSASIIKWDIDEDYLLFLPKMKSDIMLSTKEKTLIIDTKYYSKILTSNFDVETFRSNNLYQIFTYVKNQDKNHTGSVSGMLLYAKTIDSIDHDQSYIIGSNKITIKTLDLNKNFELIKKQLDEIVKKEFSL